MILRPRSVADRWLVAAMAALAIITTLVFANRAPVPDLSWLTEGARRWLGGQRLYVDVREINPPLIFYDIVLLSAGTLRHTWLVVGIVIVTLASSLWVARHHGTRAGLGTFLAITVAGSIEFGQREHLLLVFLIPYLLARGSAAERAAMGAWAFLGIGLKPYFLPIVILPALVEAWKDPRSLLAAQKVALGAALVAYLVHSWIAYPAYFSEIVPLARQLYTYGSPMPPILLVELVAIAAVLILCGRSNPALAAALVGALAGFFLQQRLWTYHFIAPAGLAILLAWESRRTSLVVALLAFQLVQGPYRRPPHPPIPDNVTSLLVVSAHLSDAYPGVPACGAVNIGSGGSLGWIPGPWATLNDPAATAADKASAQAIVAREKRRLFDDIERQRAELIIVDVAPRKAYFDHPIDYAAFLGMPPGFKRVKRVGAYDYWSRIPLSPRDCTEKY